MLDFPEIKEPPATAPAPQPAAAQQTQAIAASINVVQGEVAKFDQIAAGLKAIEDAHPKNVIVAAIDTAAGMKAAETAWRAYRNPRLEVERARKAAKAPVLALGKTIDAFAELLEIRLREGEAHYRAQIDREDERKAAIKAEQERIAREAAAAHQARVQTIAGYIARCQEPGMTADRIYRGMEHLAAVDLSDPDATRAQELTDAQLLALQSMRTLHAQAVAREAEAARQEAIRLENERVAAQLAQERARIAEEAAAIRRQSEELAAQRAESERLERLAADRRAEQAAMTHPNGAPMFGEHVKENGDRVMLDDQGKRSIFCDVDEGDASHPGQAAAAPPMNSPAPPVFGGIYRPSPSSESPADAPADAAPAVESAVIAAPMTELQALAREARESRFPTQPKMGLEWWTRFYALADAEASA